MNCSANPVENLFNRPSITWIGPDGNEVLSGESSNPMIGPQTGELVFSSIAGTKSGLYVCRAVVNISESQIVNHFDDTTITVNTDGEQQPLHLPHDQYCLCIAPGPVRNLECTESSSPSELSFSWDMPSVLGEGVNGYQIELKELQQLNSDTKDVMLVGIASFYTKMNWAHVDQGLSKHC